MTNFAKLIACTKPVDPAFGETAQEFVAYVARVSNPANQWNHETASKLCDYLERNAHWSPFEMYNIVLEIHTTRDIGRQLLRHRSFSFQEFSQRYEVAESFVVSETRLQDDKNRQNSLETDDIDLQIWWLEEQNKVVQMTTNVYRSALDLGIAKELARKILPEGLTMSRLYVNGTLRSWMHYLKVRLDPTTQKEHRELAELVAIQIGKVLHK